MTFWARYDEKFKRLQLERHAEAERLREEAREEGERRARLMTKVEKEMEDAAAKEEWPHIIFNNRV